MLESFSNKFEYKRLTEDEQKQRGILGRLVGPIADGNNPTRNNRIYKREVWEKVFEDPIMQERIANRCCFGELGHPSDREETCAEKVAVCLAEQPKFDKDGRLYGVFDILATPCGKILKSLCDYGCQIGVSSRGSGDLYTDDDGNEAVDPDTYNCEGFDVVLIPAVKAARLKYVTESLDTKTLKMKRALKESYDKASEEDKKIMKETLDSLKIDINDETITEAVEPAKSIDELPYEELEEAVDKDLDFEDEEIETEEVEEDDDSDEEDKDDNKNKEDTKKDKDADEEEEDSEDEDSEEEESEDDDSDEANIETVGDLIKFCKDLAKDFKEYDKDTKVNFVDLDINGNKISINDLFFDETDNGEIEISLGYSAQESEDIEDNKSDIAVDDQIDLADTEANIDVSEEAVDDGADEVIESLKEMVRQKESLEQTVKQIKSDKAVGDAKVEKLTEQVNRYRQAFERLSEVAAKAPKLEAKVKALNEELSKNQQRLKALTENKTQEANKVKNLTESLTEKTNKVKVLTEKLQEANKALNTQESANTDKLAQYKKALAARTKLAEQYKAKAEEAISSYVKSKASMLGVSTDEITRQLNESYSIADIDNVCDKILSGSTSMGRLPIGFTSKSRVKINESRQQPSATSPTEGYEIDESLLELAGLI